MKARSQKRAFSFLVQVGAVSYVTSEWAKSAMKCIQGLSGSSVQNKLGMRQAQTQGDLPGSFSVGQEGGGMEIRTGSGMSGYTL